MLEKRRSKFKIERWVIKLKKVIFILALFTLLVSTAIYADDTVTQVDKTKATVQVGTTDTVKSDTVVVDTQKPATDVKTNTTSSK